MTTQSSPEMFNGSPSTTAVLETASADSPRTLDGDWRSECPFSSHFIDVGSGNKVHYIDQAPIAQSSEGPVLMVHGNPTWSFYWRRLIASLSTDRRVVAIDHLGCGLSDKPTGYDYCLQNHIDNLCRLIDELDLTNITLMVHDWGGAIGMGALLARKDRFKKIILFNTATFPPPFIPLRIRVCRWPVVGRIGVQGFNLFARAAIKMATEQAGGLSKNVAEGLLAPYDSWNHRVAIYGFVKDIPLHRGHRTWKVLEQIEAGLSDVSEWPILMMWGMKDWCFRPECLDRLIEHWPKAEVHRIANAGHYVIEDAAEEVDATVRGFLDRHAS